MKPKHIGTLVGAMLSMAQPAFGEMVEVYAGRTHRILLDINKDNCVDVVRGHWGDLNSKWNEYVTRELIEKGHKFAEGAKVMPIELQKAFSISYNAVKHLETSLDLYRQGKPLSYEVPVCKK